MSDRVEYLDFGFDPSETEYPLNDQGNRDALIGLFQTVFTEENSPYDEDWDYEVVDDFLEWTSEMDYEGTIAVLNDEPIGFSWGYRVDSDEVDVDEKFPDGLEEVNPDIYDGSTFMIDEVGVSPDYRGNGIGTQVEARTLRKAAERDNLDRAMQRTQWSGENSGKLWLDGRMGFSAFLQGEENDPVTQEVEFVGKPGSDERIYLGQEF
ncbi:GNAT family N-acetyltransferase [Candidatus Nanohalovita haloferacivicina]|uniref:GNAT family N-acetyltransferase n=1 Tax=Candidatus Nanohalovita haloferacivicina TaxID=2978046 RepID=UPI00325FD47F|nr:hypothetical protein HBNXNv_0562 [Candidatus Nanohalobia archaeon BNXNv]